ncbi:MAG TPA: SDR family NAD(P)-dependent oxidoreductase [Myxococcota bacterium]|nr:SDR family NAD(P)-dependent oxidoreductase [Myxococcales bacterium]HPG24575.1 SDR family NAD(P)-dependent oxidoreductase [Myxococcota bacterium]
MKDFAGKVAVVTGGAGDIGKAIARALLARGAKVVISDVEKKALDAAVSELSAGGEISGIVTDVSKPESVEALAEAVYDRYGVCHLLFNNAGVGAPSVPVWETTVNDWKWVFGVNVMGVVHGIHAFVPRMIAGGQPGHVINTSSGDGGIAPMSGQSVYASSKASVSIITECLDTQFRGEHPQLKATIFYPAGGVLKTGIWSCDRNRPPELAREKPSGQPEDLLGTFMKAADAAGMEVHFQDLDELARTLLADLEAEKFISMIGIEGAGDQLRARAEKIGRGESPADEHSLLA